MTDAVKEVANNDVLQQAVAKIIEKSLQGIDTTTSFLSAQLPDVIHQLLMWKAVSSFITLIIGVFLLTTSTILLYKVVSAFSSKKESTLVCKNPWGTLEPSPKGYVAIFYSFIGSLAGLAMVLNNWTWLKIWIAPKIYLIEYAAGLVK